MYPALIEYDPFEEAAIEYLLIKEAARKKSPGIGARIAQVLTSPVIAGALGGTGVLLSGLLPAFKQGIRRVPKSVLLGSLLAGALTGASYYGSGALWRYLYAKALQAYKPEVTIPKGHIFGL